MRAPSHPDRGAVGINMTPMIDIVFLLIIFFIVSSHLAQQELQVELALPAADSGETATEGQRRLVVHVPAVGPVLLGNTPVEPGQLAQRMQYEADQVGGELEVRIRCDRGVPYQTVEPILTACAKAGIWNVSFAVLPRSGR